MNLFKHIVRFLLLIVRILVVFTAAWLIVEFFYLKQTGKYIVYYNFWFKSAENIYEYIYITDSVFNIQQDWFAYIFSDYYVPVALGVSIAIFFCDLLGVIYNKKYIVLCLFDISLALTMLSLLFP